MLVFDKLRWDAHDPTAFGATITSDCVATVLGIPFDGGTTDRAGTRFGPQGLRKITAHYTAYNSEMAVGLPEQMTLWDAGDVFTIPANIEKTFDRITGTTSHVVSSGSLPITIGGGHFIGFPCVRGIAQRTSKKIGIFHFDRHADIQEKNLDELRTRPQWRASAQACGCDANDKMAGWHRVPVLLFTGA